MKIHEIGAIGKLIIASASVYLMFRCCLKTYLDHLRWLIHLSVDTFAR